MGITEILRWIWIFHTNKMKSSESFNKQPTQLIVQLNSSLRDTIVALVVVFCYSKIFLPVTCCVRRFPMMLIPIIQLKWFGYIHIVSNPIPPPLFIFSPRKELGTDGIVRSWGWGMGTFTVHFSVVDIWEVTHCVWAGTKIISITRKLSRSPASNFRPVHVLLSRFYLDFIQILSR